MATALPSPNPALFPDPAERMRIDDLLTRELARAQKRVAQGPVVAERTLAEAQADLARFDFSAPQTLEDLIGWTIEQMEHGVVHITHPRYFGLFNPAPTFPSQCADRIAGEFNPQLASSVTSPAAVAIEMHMIRAIARRAGLPEETGGHFTVSGSEANYTALLCALTRAEPGFAEDGVRAFRGPVAFYTSRECQPAWHKIAHQAGVGRSALRLVATDGTGRMDPPALADAIAADRARGVVPVLVAATAGTTGGGMVDPLEPCAEIALASGCWYHVDAAWGGAALASDHLAPLLRGIERADSVTIDAHKWFATTMGAGMFLSRHPDILSETFRVTSSFMPSESARVDPYISTAQWSRRFMGLRLFLSLGAASWEGYAAHVERAAQTIARVRERLTARGWVAVNESPLAVLCAIPPAGSPPVREIVRRVVSGGRAWVAPTSFEGRDVVRICATHGETAMEDVDALVDALQAAL